MSYLPITPSRLGTGNYHLMGSTGNAALFLRITPNLRSKHQMVSSLEGFMFFLLPRLELVLLGQAFLSVLSRARLDITESFLVG